MSTRSILNTCSASLAVLLTLGACGGGGAADPSAKVVDPGASTAATVSGLVPGATMNWGTASERSMTLAVQAADGRPAAGAAVRVFTLSRTSPQDGSALDEPVPVSLLDTVVSDATGHANLTLQWPGHVNELLVVATLQDTQGRTVLTANAGTPELLQLTR